MATLNAFVSAIAVPAHPHDRARQLERARILLSGAVEHCKRRLSGTLRAS